MRDHKFVGVVHKSVYDNSKVRDGYIGTTKNPESIDLKSNDSEIRTFIIDVPNQSISI